MSSRRKVHFIAVIALGFVLASLAHAQPQGDRSGNAIVGESHAEPAQKPKQNIQLPSKELQSTTYATKAGKSVTSEERDRARRDLAAQEDMARWAKWMLLVGATETAITLAGVVLVWRTLIYTKDAAIYAGAAVEEAKRSTKAAEETVLVTREALVAADRAWIKTNLQLVGDLVFGKENIEITVRCIIENIGKSPAAQVEEARIDMFPDIVEAGLKADDDVRIEKRLSPIAINYGRTLFPEDKFEREYVLELPIECFRKRIVEIARHTENADANITMRPAILFGVRYRIPEDPKFRFTYIPFEIRSSIENHLGWDGSECIVPAKQLTAVQYFLSGHIR